MALNAGSRVGLTEALHPIPDPPVQLLTPVMVNGSAIASSMTGDLYSPSSLSPAYLHGTGGTHAVRMRYGRCVRMGAHVWVGLVV